jgi:hypothetical protein
MRERNAHSRAVVERSVAALRRIAAEIRARQA